MSKSTSLIVAVPPEPPKADKPIEVGTLPTATSPVTMPPVPPRPAPAPPPLPTHPVPKTVDQTLVTILSWKRKHGSPTEMLFLAWLRDQITSRGGVPRVHTEGNVSVTIMPPKGAATDTLFSCHVDTCHRSVIPVGPGAANHVSRHANDKQVVMYDPNYGHLFLAEDDQTWDNVLGADDGAGVWLLLEMIQAKVPGTYLFHRGEECGFIGANAMLTREKDFLKQFSLAVAFDRPFVSQVITSQGGDRCCSDKFANALAQRLNDSGVGLSMVKYDRGGVTDTKVYRGVIAECANVAVGYKLQHSPKEELDYGYLLRLRDAVIKMDWASLPIDRDPAVIDPVPNWHANQNWGNYGAHGGHQRGFDDGDSGWDTTKRVVKATGKSKKKKAHDRDDIPSLPTEMELEGQSFVDVLCFIEEHAEEAAGMMIDTASEIAALKAQVKFLKGTLK